MFWARYRLNQFAIINEETIQKYKANLMEFLGDDFHDNEQKHDYVKSNNSQIGGSSGMSVGDIDEEASARHEEISRPIIENYPHKVRQKVIRYDIEHNKSTLSGGIGHSAAIRVPFR